MRRMSVALKRASAFGAVVEPLVVVLSLSAPLGTFLFRTSDIVTVRSNRLMRMRKLWFVDARLSFLFRGIYI